MSGTKIDFLGIGVDQYPDWDSDRHSTHLDYASSDCNKLHRALSDVGILGRSIVVNDTHPTLRPVRNDIYRSVHRFLQRSEPHHPRIFYFAGHGVTVGGALSLCPADFDPDIAERTAIDVSELLLLFCESSPWSLFILDCCRSPLLDRGADQHKLAGGVVRIYDNSLVMFACSNGERSYEVASVDGTLVGGVFTHFLVEGISRLLGRRNSRTNVGKLFSYVRDATSEFVGGKERTQIPRLVGAQGSDFFVSRDQAIPPKVRRVAAYRSEGRT